MHVATKQPLMKFATLDFALLKLFRAGSSSYAVEATIVPEYACKLHSWEAVYFSYKEWKRNYAVFLNVTG